MERRVRTKFSGSGTTDSGLTFGTSYRAHLAADATDGNATNAGNIYVSGAFGTLSFGSESSAAEYAVGDLAGVGFTGAGSKNETTFIGTANTAFVYTYSAGAVTAMVSGGEAAGVGGKKLSSKEMAVGVKYSAGDLTLGAGYEKTAADQNTVMSVQYVMNDTTLKAVFGSQSGKAGQMGASVSHKMDAITLSGFYRSVDDVAGVSKNYSGIGAAYDFGGGMAAKAGYADNAGKSTIEAGLNFSF